MIRLRNRVLIVSLIGLAAAPSPARASIPLSVFTVPTQVEYLPDAQNATKVVIHGSFFFYMNGGNYSLPRCGVMYFACKPGEEKMCRMQWAEIAALVGQMPPPSCIGFGQQQVMSVAQVWIEGGPLGNPDTWDNGMGTFKTASNWCQWNAQPKCPLGMPNADMAGPPPPPPDLSVPPPPRDLSMPAPPDLSMAPRDQSMSPAQDLSVAPPAPDLAAPQPTPDLSQSPPAPGGCSCAVATRSSSPDFGLAGVLLLMALGLGRRRPR